MSARGLAVLWLIAGAAVGSGVFDLYVSRGAREYLQKQAEFELGRGPQPDMAQVMFAARRDGLYAAVFWGAGISTAGWLTIVQLRKRASSSP